MALVGFLRARLTLIVSFSVLVSRNDYSQSEHTLTPMEQEKQHHTCWLCMCILVWNCCWTLTLYLVNT